MHYFYPIEMWYFIIQTNKYLGNFDSRLCVYLTGIIDSDTAMYQKESELFYKEMNLNKENNIFNNITSNKAWPFDIHKNKITKEYDSLSILFPTKPSEEQIQILKDRSVKYTEYVKENGYPWEIIKDLEIKKYYLIKRKISYEEMEV